MDKTSPPYRKDELSVAELLHFGGAYVEAVKKNIWYIIGIGMVCAAVSFFYYSSKPTLYKARLSFMLNEDESSQMSNVSAILGQFGLPMMNQRVNISKVLELSLSRKIIQEAIFNEIETSNGPNFLSNHIIDIYELNDRWNSKELEMSNFKFTNAKVDSFSIKENIALKSIATMIAGTPANRKNALIETDYGQNTTIMSFVTHSQDEALSYHLTHAVFEATSNFYVEKTIEKQTSTYDVLVSKKDSLLKEYNRLEYKYADLSDKSTGLFSKKMDIKKERARGEMLQLSAGLSKLEEQISLVEFSIENSTPILQVIDAPILPLEEVTTSKFKSILIGLGFGLILSIGAVVFITLWRLIKETEV